MVRIRFATYREAPGTLRSPFHKGISWVTDPIGVLQGNDTISPIGISNLPLLGNRSFDWALFPVNGRRPTAMSTGVYPVHDRARRIGLPRSGGAARYFNMGNDPFMGCPTR